MRRANELEIMTRVKRATIAAKNGRVFREVQNSKTSMRSECEICILSVYDLSGKTASTVDIFSHLAANEHMKVTKITLSFERNGDTHKMTYS